MQCIESCDGMDHDVSDRTVGLEAPVFPTCCQTLDRTFPYEIGSPSAVKGAESRNPAGTKQGYISEFRVRRFNVFKEADCRCDIRYESRRIEERHTAAIVRDPGRCNSDKKQLLQSRQR